MRKRQPIELFMPPNVLKAKMGGSGDGLDPTALARAEQALEGLKAEFAVWIDADVTALGAARDAFAADQSRSRQEDLYRASHDLRGQARTFEFPIVERVASSLCRMLEIPAGSAALPLIDAHVGAIRVIVRDNIRNNTNLMAVTLAGELEGRVTELLAQSAARAAVS